MRVKGFAGGGDIERTHFESLLGLKTLSHTDSPHSSQLGESLISRDRDSALSSEKSYNRVRDLELRFSANNLILASPHHKHIVPFAEYGHFAVGR